jgi:hypothetical protein
VPSFTSYAIAYIGLFALPLLGTAAFRSGLPMWVRLVSAAGLASSVVSLAITVYPIVDVASPATYAAKIGSVVVLANVTGVGIYYAGRARQRSTAKRLE